MRSTRARLLALTMIPGMMLLFGSKPIQAQISGAKLDIRMGRDIAVNANGTVWTIGGEATPNATIQRLVGSSLVTQPGSAVRIAVDPSGNAWIVNSNGDLYHWEKTGTSAEAWVLSSLKAMDVAAGASGAVWAVGTDHRIMELRDGTWTAISGAGDRIAVDPAGNPWVTNASHDVWHYTGKGWISIPGKAQDVAVAPDRSVFVIGMTPKAGGFQILKMTGGTWTEIPAPLE